MTVSVAEQLRAFASTLLESRGALVEWPAADGGGTAVLTPEAAAALGAPEAVSLNCESSAEGLSVNLAGDFLEWAGRLLEAVPSVGDFRVRDPYLKRKELVEGVARAFTWLNAKVKFREARETTVEYHTWWFHAALHSEDRWETTFSVSLNSASGVEVEIPDPLGLWELQPRAGASATKPSSLDLAALLARRRLPTLAASFIRRMDSRLLRDRQRLRDYYNALLREAGRKKPRAGAPPNAEEIAASRRAVNLELRRKLAELGERYTMDAALRPILLIRTETPVLAVDLRVHRKRAEKTHTIYWNPLVKRFDPLRCGLCGEGVFAAAFANETVVPLCRMCHEGA